jgi:LytS/YehU family sensor histidine kinase
VENSVKFAVAKRRDGGTIVVRATRDAACLRVAVEDDGPGFGSVDVEAGHGLALLRDRLATLYGAGATLAVTAIPHGGSVVLTIPEPR